jgi:hypothetical protein
MSKKSFKRLVFIILLLSGLLPGVQATALKVTTTKDSVPGSLRAAITTANSNGEGDTIYLPAGTYILQGAADEDSNTGGDLDISTNHSIIIIGDGPGSTIIDGNKADRVLHILSGTVSITGVTIRNGRLNCPENPIDPSDIFTFGDPHGGGIYNNGTLTLRDCIVNDNRSKEGCFYIIRMEPIPGWGTADAGHGGGIYNKGVLTLYHCTISNNKAEAGLFQHMAYSSSGNGGGIYNKGTLYLTNSVINDNWLSGGGSKGAGIFNCGTMELGRCTITNNTTGIGRETMETHTFFAESGGYGGGIYNLEGKAVLSYCTISSNKTGDGGSSEYAGNGGCGAGIFNRATLIINNSAIINNITGNAGKGDWEGTWGGDGGGICNSEGKTTLTNCTISGNFTGEGNIASYDPVGEGGYGAGIYNAAELSLESCTVSYNITGKGEDNSTGGPGGGIYCCADGTVYLHNTIVADNQVAAGGEGPDCWGTFSSQGYNLIENINNCKINGEHTGNITGVDPQLGPLANNGGFTKTHALLSASPAVDSGSGSGLSIDQRGYIRPMDNLDIINVNDGADIGAYEYNAASLPQISLNPNLLNFGIETSNNEVNSQTFFIDNGGEGTLEWSINPDVGWLNCTPVSGTGQGMVIVQVDNQALSPGAHIGHITVEAPGAINSPQIVTVILRVYTTGSTSSPFGVFATPLEGITVSGSIAVTGWVLDDIGVQSVQLYREDGNSLVYIGDALFVEGARPDVEQAYPGYPFNYKAGWGYIMLTNFLPNGGNGTFTIHATATDFEGNQVTLGTKTIICDNANRTKPFGAIDTPTLGGIASGSDFINFGWALTPLPNTIPSDGSSITVWVDSVPLGNVVFNQYRNDITTLFPGYNNSAGAGGYFYLDTTQYENGVHTISWSVTDSAGNTDGIGSRYFRIQNSGDTVSGKAQSAMYTAYSIPASVSGISQIPIDYSNPIRVIKGYNQNNHPQIIYPDDRGDIIIEIKQLQRIEIWLSERTEGLASLSGNIESSTSVPGGFHLMGDRLEALPIGSFLDSKNGIFSWVPGPGFLRDYTFTFIEKSKTGEMKRRLITVRIRPQFE